MTQEECMAEQKRFKDECRKHCADILANTRKDPKSWFADYLEIEEKGNIVRVYVTLGGPTVWWAFNKATKRGRLYYHHGSAQAYKNFGKQTYEKLMQFVY